MIYSHSRLSTFENCKLAFKFRYIDKIETGLDGIEAFMGSRVHDSLEYLYNKVKMGVIPEMAEILKHYVEGWEKEFHEGVRVIKKGFTHEDYKKLGEKCIIDYYSQNYPFEQNVIENEKGVVVDIDGIKLRGFIDRLDWNGDTLEIHDYKTGGSLPPQSKIDKDRQLALYQIACQDLFPEAKDYKLIWHYLVFGKKLVSKRTQEDLEELKKNIKKLVGEIETEKEFLPKVSRLCDWCEYKNICPAWGHKNMDDKNWKKEEGEELVKKYVSLRNELSSGKKELDSLKKDIMDYSEQLNVQLLFAEDHQVRINETSRLVMPKNSKIENELINLLNSEGLYDKVSGINMTALAELLETLPEELQKKIRPFLHEEKTKRITVSKKKE